MIFEIERGKHLACNFNWADFIVTNPDIMTSLNNSPLKLQRMTSQKFKGGIFGVQLLVEHISNHPSDNRGCLRVLTDVRLPFSLGRTYANATHNYFGIDDHTTSLELKIDLEVTGIISFYAWLRRRSITKYIDQVCTDIENAAHLLESEDETVDKRLDETQKIKVAELRKKIAHKTTAVKNASQDIDASVNISLVNDVMLLEADAIMPDKHLIKAKNVIQKENSEFRTILTTAKQLACINNPAFAIRGDTPSDNIDIEFHQAAFEFGYKLYHDYFSENLADIMPILMHHGKGTSIRFNIDEHLEPFPWEVLHDGKDFLVTKLRFSRSLGSVRQSVEQNTGGLAEFGILLVAPDSRGDLPGTLAETQAIEKILSDIGVSKVERLAGPKANRQNVLKRMQSGEFNVLHFSGHSVFNSAAPYQSHLELSMGTKLSLHEFGSLANLETSSKRLNLVFLNSCQSGRAEMDETSGRNLSMCRIFRESGVDNVIGMLWNVSDEAAAQVASVFYKFLATNQFTDVAEAMRQTRCKVAMDRAWQDGSWLAPVLYT